MNTAHGAGIPVGIGTIRIGWYDDYGKYHGFELPDVYHMPNSCTNVLGVLDSSKIIGDFDREGTRINSSEKNSISTRDDHKIIRHFKHPALRPPEMKECYEM